MPYSATGPTATRTTVQGAGEYTGVGHTSHYENTTGLVVIPRAREGATPKLVRVHGDYGMRKVSWSASRKNRPPLIPTQEDLLSDKYVGGVVSADMPIADPISGGYNWSISGEYLYFQSVRARKAGFDPLPTGAYPYTIQPQDTIAQSILSATYDTGFSNVIEGKIAATGAEVVDQRTLYPWPFTALPIESTSSGLIGG